MRNNLHLCKELKFMESRNQKAHDYYTGLCMEGLEDAEAADDVAGALQLVRPNIISGVSTADLLAAGPNNVLQCTINKSHNSFIKNIEKPRNKRHEK